MTRSPNAVTTVAHTLELLRCGRPDKALRALSTLPRRIESELRSAYEAGWADGQEALCAQIVGDDAADEATAPAQRRGGKASTAERHVNSELFSTIPYPRPGPRSVRTPDRRTAPGIFLGAKSSMHHHT
jgi:hypothetical protein